MSTFIEILPLGCQAVLSPYRYLRHLSVWRPIRNRRFSPMAGLALARFFSLDKFAPRFLRTANKIILPKFD
jgi:hypothetical protein